MATPSTPSTASPSLGPSAPADARRRIPVAGADAVLDELHAAIAAGAAPGVAAARSLAHHRVEWAPIRAAIVGSEHSIILAGDDAGPVLGARAFDPDRPTTVHDHGCAGAAIVVEGRQRYERFTLDEPGRGTARLESIHDLAPGDVVWWGEPPDDVHRQRAHGAVAIELVLLCGSVGEVATLTPAEPGEASPFRRAFVDGFLAGDVIALRRWYHDDPRFDLNVPHWRLQLRGREPALQLLHEEEFAQAGRRLAFLRATDTSAGLLLETEGRHVDADGRAHAFRELHQLRLRDGLVAEHVVWCTGVNDPDTIRQQFETAPMERM